MIGFYFVVTAKTQYSLNSAKRYFHEHLSVGDYYQEGQKTSGEWFGVGTLGNWKAKGLLPYIKIGRRCLYDWASVQGALLRRQRGGQP